MAKMMILRGAVNEHTDSRVLAIALESCVGYWEVVCLGSSPQLFQNITGAKLWLNSIGKLLCSHYKVYSGVYRE